MKHPVSPSLSSPEKKRGRWEDEEKQATDHDRSDTVEMGRPLIMNLGRAPDHSVGMAENQSSDDIKIPALPVDILLQIFDYFHAIHWHENNDWVRKRERMHIIQNLRLVCRQFNQLASPYLFSELPIHLDQESLDNACKLLENPLICQGVRGIRVVLEYRPKQVADSTSRFAKIRIRELGEIERDCSWKFDESSKPKAGEEESPSQAPRQRESPQDGAKIDAAINKVPAVTEKPGELYRTAMENYEIIKAAWAESLEVNDEAVLDDSWDEFADFVEVDSQEEYSKEVCSGKDTELSEYRDMLLRAHEEYAKKHKEQLRLVKSGGFCRTLASSLARVKSPITLTLADGPVGNPFREIDALILADKTELSKFLIRPSTWGMAWGVTNVVSLEVVKVLSDLPIALMRDGIVLKQLEIFCFPTEDSFSLLKPSTGSWGDLEKAFAHMELFRFEGPSVRCGSLPHGFIPTDWELSNMDKYLRAAFSGHSLGSVHLSARCLNAVPIHSIFRSVRWPGIENISISNFSLSQRDISDLCKGIASDGRIHTFNLELLYLREGSSKVVLDLLREVAVQHGCTVELKDPRGQSFGEHSSIWDQVDEELETAINRYISGNRDVSNPMDGEFRRQGTVESPLTHPEESDPGDPDDNI